MEDINSFLFKIILIGDSGVGKTCLARRFIQGEFPVNKGATIGVDFMIKSMLINGIKVNLQLWDTAGQERFRSITQSYYRSAHCLILVYDISSQPSFDSLSQWCRDIKNYTSTPLDGSSDVMKVLIGNKCDKECEVPSHVGQQFAESNQFDMFIETSALHLNNVDQFFQDIAQLLVEKRLANMSTLATHKQKHSQQHLNAQRLLESSNHHHNLNLNPVSMNFIGDLGTRLSNTINRIDRIRLNTNPMFSMQKIQASCCKIS